MEVILAGARQPAGEARSLAESARSLLHEALLVNAEHRKVTVQLRERTLGSPFRGCILNVDEAHVA
jgi:hypothetical protein